MNAVYDMSHKECTVCARARTFAPCSWCTHMPVEAQCLPTVQLLCLCLLLSNGSRPCLQSQAVTSTLQCVRNHNCAYIYGLKGLQRSWHATWNRACYTPENGSCTGYDVAVAAVWADTPYPLCTKAPSKGNLHGSKTLMSLLLSSSSRAVGWLTSKASTSSASWTAFAACVSAPACNRSAGLDHTRA